MIMQLHLCILFTFVVVVYFGRGYKSHIWRRFIFEGIDHSHLMTPRCQGLQIRLGKDILRAARKGKYGQDF